MAVIFVPLHLLKIHIALLLCEWIKQFLPLS